MLLLIDMLERVGFLTAIAFVFSRSKWMRSYWSYQGEGRNKWLFILFFSFFAVIGTYSGVAVSGLGYHETPFTGHVSEAAAIANSRTVGVVIAGLVGGVEAGFIVGIIAGIHRYSLGGFVAFACMIAPIMQGILSGLARKALRKRFGRKSSVQIAFLVGFLAESLQMLLILFLAKPFDQALDLIRLIGIPQTLTNSIGVALFFMLHIQIQNEEERIGALYTSKALQIADQTLPLWKLHFPQAVKGVLHILVDEIQSVGAAFMRERRIISKVGIQSPYWTDIPLEKEDKRSIGIFRIFYSRKHELTEAKIVQQQALSKLLSQQYAFAESGRQSQLLADAEIRALQAQMNPHFLFNVLNTVMSFIRSKPNDARKMISQLATFLRKNMENSNKPLISIRDEIELVNAYLNLIKARMGETLEVNIQVDEVTLDKPIPPFTIQPLVENAIVHGLKNINRTGKIMVAVQHQEELTSITVQDNGKGMENTAPNEDIKEHMGLALSNIEQRLKHHFGVEQALQIESKENQGTTVSFSVR